ncbi:hypothetical protein GCM10022224_081310 [Nonomuraea antimicrobica]|uniref:Uncharacterized protein n=1 Tax=Nonomuraea antimicrobica TaxID=561173 RepID=A0ABP7DF14_9ACTN
MDRHGGAALLGRRAGLLGGLLGGHGGLPFVGAGGADERRGLGDDDAPPRGGRWLSAPLPEE